MLPLRGKEFTPESRTPADAGFKPTFGGSVWACRNDRVRHTTGMRTANSLPDAEFLAAEGEAKCARKSRGQLYAEGLLGSVR